MWRPRRAVVRGTASAAGFRPNVRLNAYCGRYLCSCIGVGYETVEENCLEQKLIGAETEIVAVPSPPLSLPSEPAKWFWNLEEAAVKP